jgi:hypothetical protein
MLVREEEKELLSVGVELGVEESGGWGTRGFAGGETRGLTARAFIAVAVLSSSSSSSPLHFEDILSFTKAITS